MDVEYLLGSVLRGVLTGRGKRKKTKGAMRYVLGNPRAVGGGAVLLGGLAFALYEHVTKGGGLGTGSAAPPLPAAPTAAPAANCPASCRRRCPDRDGLAGGAAAPADSGRGGAGRTRRHVLDRRHDRRWSSTG